MGLFKPNIKKMLKKKDVNGLVKALEHKYVDIIDAATEALGEIGDTNTIEPLIEVFKDNCRNNISRWLRWPSANALEKFGSLAVEPLLSCLDTYQSSHEYKDLYVIEATIAILGNIGDSRAIDPIAKFIDHKNKDVCLMAAKVLDKLDDPRGKKTLTALLKDQEETEKKKIEEDEEIYNDIREDEDWQSRVQKGSSVVEAIFDKMNASRFVDTADVITLGTYYFDAYILPFLIKCVKTDHQIKYVPGRSLPGTLSITVDTEFENPWLKCGYCFAIRFRNRCPFSNKIIDSLVHILLKHKDPTVRWQSANVLRALKDERSLNGLRKASQSWEASDYRDEAIDALEEIESSPLFEIIAII